jgi:tyrosyl-tRNA synthetase
MFKGGGKGGASTESLNRIFVTPEDLSSSDGVKIVDLIVRLGLASSKKEARRLIQGGGAKLNEVKVEDENAVVTADDFHDGKEVTLRAGKKRAGVVELN